MYSTKFKPGDILSSKDKEYMGVVIEINIVIKKEGVRVKYELLANQKRYFIYEEYAVKLEEACPF